MKLDIYRPKNADGLVPVIAFTHGGGWAIGTRRIIEPAFVKQVKRGYAVVSISYTMSNRACWPTQIHEVKAGYRWVRANADRFGFDANRIIAAGGSAGAHLALVSALSGPGKLEGELGETNVSSDVSAVIALYPPTDLGNIHRNGRIGKRTIEALLGGRVSNRQDALNEATPSAHVHAGAPPVYIMHGTIDHVVPYAHATTLVEAITETGGKAELVTLPGVAHADWRFNSGKPLAGLEAFLDQASAK